MLLYGFYIEGSILYYPDIDRGYKWKISGKKGYFLTG